jgi:hypothetical protein
MQQECCSPASIFFPSTQSTVSQECTTTTEAPQPVEACFSFIPGDRVTCNWPDCNLALGVAVASDRNNSVINNSSNSNENNGHNSNHVGEITIEPYPIDTYPIMTLPPITTSKGSRRPETRSTTSTTRRPSITRPTINATHSVSSTEIPIPEEGIEANTTDTDNGTNSQNTQNTRLGFKPHESLEKCSSNINTCGRSRFYIFNFLKVKIYCCLEDDPLPNTEARFSVADNVIDEVVDDCARSMQSCRADETQVRVFFVLDFWCCMPSQKWDKQYH